MNPHVNTIANRLSLRSPQRDSLEILERLCDIISLEKNTDITQALKAVQSEYATVTDFERDFPSLCFALATGVGKTRLMGAFIAYLFKAEGIRNFFVLAPNLTIYNKLIADFTPNTTKYVFQGLAEFSMAPPVIITGDNYENADVTSDGELFESNVRINIFNVSKITSTVTPKGAAKTTVPRFRRLHEYIGQSYFDYLSGLDDLVLLMDESHRYRASAGMRAISELKPILGLELTATPKVEHGNKTQPFKNVVYAYPLSSAMTDGFVKEPAVATRENFNPRDYSAKKMERLKLEDGIRLHENTRVELEVYARENRRPIVKPFMLVIARDTTHANTLMKTIEAKEFFKGRYKGRVIQVHSKQVGEERDETIAQLIDVEKPDNATEVVIHVNMLKEGWDVTNLYTIVPLRAAKSQTLVEQSIGRGLRLPYGKRTGVAAVDRLTIVSHDKFQEIVDYANSEDSIIQGGMKIIYVSDKRSRVVTAEPEITQRIQPSSTAKGKGKAKPAEPLFKSLREQEVAKATLEVIRQDFEHLARSVYLAKPKIRKQVIERVMKVVVPEQKELRGTAEQVDVARIVEKTIGLRNELSIDIPRISVQPVGKVTRGFADFTLDLAGVRLQPVDDEILIQELHHRKQYRIMSDTGSTEEQKPEDYIVRGLMEFNDISYDDHSALLYKLGGQVVKHLRSYLKKAGAVLNVLQYHQPTLVNLVHAQMQDHFEEKATAYRANVSKGFTALRSNSYSARAEEAERDFHTPVSNKLEIRKMLFAGFAKCLYRIQKFDSDSERHFAVVLENDDTVLKWFKPATGNFQIHYKDDASYEPDFVVETQKAKYLCEPKAANEMTAEMVVAKAEAAVEWCGHATEHEKKHGGKPWIYLLIPHDRITDNKTLAGLAAAHTYSGSAPASPNIRQGKTAIRKELRFIDYILGDPSTRVHLDAVHASNKGFDGKAIKRPPYDEFTGEIVEAVAAQTLCHGIIGRISRGIADLNRDPDARCGYNYTWPLDPKFQKPAIKEFRMAIKSILAHTKILDGNGKANAPYLQLAIHGFNAPKTGIDIDLGVRKGDACCASAVLKKVKNILSSKEYGFNVTSNKIYQGDKSKEIHRHSYGKAFNTIQVEINRTARKTKFDMIVQALREVVKQF